MQNDFGKTSGIKIAGDEVDIERLREVAGEETSYEMLMKHFYLPPQ